MALHLTASDHEILNGSHGPAAQLAMRVLVRMGEILGAERMIDITQAHIDGCALMSETALAFAERMAALGARTAVPTTLNMIPLDLRQWQQQGISQEYGERATRLAQAYESMGCIPTWTCAPYQGYLAPRFGQQIAWGESNAIAYANSVLGARTERYADFLDLCAAVAGRVPEIGLHRVENRRGQVLVRLAGFDAAAFAGDIFYTALGFLLGRIARRRIPVVDGLEAVPTSDQLKALGASAASSGAVGLFHIVGVTPEAPTLEAAFQNQAPQQVVELTPADIAAALRELSTLPPGAQPLDAVVLGCPHFSFDEFRQLAAAIERVGAARHPRVRFLVITNRATQGLLQGSREAQILAGFGVEIAYDTCVFHCPLLSEDTRVTMTNSGKWAYYAPGELSAGVVFGSLDECVHAAVDGSVQGPAAGADAAPLREFPQPADPLAPAFTAGLPRVGRRMVGRALVSGAARGQAVVSRQPLSFWGGVNAATGEVIDRRHDCSGKLLAGKVFVFPTGRGSSTGSAVLLEAIHNGVAPAAIINVQADAILSLGVVIAETFFEKTIPVVILGASDFERIQDGDTVQVYPDGSVVISPGETNPAAGEAGTL